MSSSNRSVLGDISSSNNTNGTKINGKTIEQMYQKKTQLEHILLRPDTYIGSIQKITYPMWVYDQTSNKIISKNTTYVPGLYKIFDEILVNAADNKQRDPRGMNTLKVTLDSKQNTISVYNNGRGIPVAIHKEHQIYVPEMIFGHLLTSSNYDDDEKKVTGGRNGYGAKLANIFSIEFTIETADMTHKKKYSQTFRNNMTVKEEPIITDYTGPDYTCVTFKPDLQRFKMDSLDNDIMGLFMKRVYDMTGILGSSVNVFLNQQKLSISNFNDYVGMYITDTSAARIWERIGPRWEICVTLSDGVFGQVSFVNGIATTKGGQHVNYITDQICNAVAEVINKKNKGVEVKPAHVKNYLFIFVNCLIENPAFDSQTKETLTTRKQEFGSDAELSEKFMKSIMNTGIVDRVLNYAKFKATSELQRVSGGKRSASRLFDLPKLDDANFAGTNKSSDCTLILTEGDSAKSLAVAGLSVVGRDYFGVFPLKGKLLNVREASHKTIMANTEIQNIVKIMGLQYGHQYTSIQDKSLRYGHLVIMADQDHDGSHIKGLVLNFLHHFWPSLLRIPGFVREFITPIVKVSKGVSSIPFFTLPQYKNWKDSLTTTHGWSIKYYKGLGTSTATEAKEYFSDMNRHQIDFAMDEPQETGYSADDLIDLAFSKKRADDRKDWIGKFEPGTFVDYDVEKMFISDFIRKELILFSVADNVRSIPSIVDGLKPAQRKVLFAAFKRNLKTDIKVAQLAGYVSEHASYHHGEAALASTIVGMAQNFVGSNNIALLVPSGQFGTRLMGGKDAASARYIFTRLAPITRIIYHPDDDALLDYQDDDGQSIEPIHYIPIIPMVLINGAEGIGTGWSTSVPNFNPRDIIKALRLRIQGELVPTLTPWYRGFNGTIVAKDSTGTTFTASGIASVDEKLETFTITELPLGKWTQDYKQFLISLITGEKEKEKEKEKAAKAKGATKGTAATKTTKGKSTNNNLALPDATTTNRNARTTKGKAASIASSMDLEELDDDDGSLDFDDDDDFDVDNDDDEEEDDDEFDSDDSDNKRRRNKKKGGKPKSKATEEKEAFAALLPPPGEPLIKEFNENHTDTRVHFTITTTPAANKLMTTCLNNSSDENNNASAAVRKVFKLETSLSTANMHLFDENGTIKRYTKAAEIIEEFYHIRMNAYEKRKNYLINKVNNEVEKLRNKVRFILAVLKGELIVSNRKKAELLAELHDSGFKGYENTNDDDDDSDDTNEVSIGKAGSSLDIAALSKRYHYLLSLPLWSLTYERVATLRNELNEKETELIKLKNTTPASMWLRDLDALETALDTLDNELAAAEEESDRIIRGTKGKKGKGAASTKAGATKNKKKNLTYVSDDDDNDDALSFEDDEEDSDYDTGRKKKAGKGKATSSNIAATTITSTTTTSTKQPVASKAAAKPASSTTTTSTKTSSSASSNVVTAKAVTTSNPVPPPVPVASTSTVTSSASSGFGLDDDMDFTMGSFGSLAQRLAARIGINDTAVTKPTITSSSIFSTSSTSTTNSSGSLLSLALTTPSTTTSTVAAPLTVKPTTTTAKPKKITRGERAPDSPTKVSTESSSILDISDDMSGLGITTVTKTQKLGSPELKRKKNNTTTTTTTTNNSTTISKAASTKPSATAKPKAAPAKVTKPKAKKSMDDDDDDDDIVRPTSKKTTSTTSARPSRATATKKKSYREDDDDDDEDDFFDDEEDEDDFDDDDDDDDY